MASSSHYTVTSDVEEPPKKRVWSAKTLKEVRISKEDRVVALEMERVRVASQIGVLEGVLEGIEAELIFLL